MADIPAATTFANCTLGEQDPRRTSATLFLTAVLTDATCARQKGGVTVPGRCAKMGRLCSSVI